jgi:hypothetical protein
MKRKLSEATSRFSGRFVLFTILAIAAVTVFITDQATQAQRPERREKRGADRPGRGRQMNPGSLIESSWTELTFGMKVDDETLLKSRSAHQKAWDNIRETMEEARQSGSWEGTRDTMKQINEEFMGSLKEVLTEEQLTQLKTSQKERLKREFRGGGRRGEGKRREGRRGGGKDK